MTEHLSASDITQYRRGIVAAPDEMLALDDHLASCGACRALVAEGERVGQVMSSLRAEMQNIIASDADHLSFENLSGYVDGSLDPVEAEMTESHLAVCRDCENEARDLVVFREAASPQFTKEYAPPPVVITPPSRPASRRNVFAFLWPRASSGTPVWAMLATAAVILAVVTTAWIVLRSQTERMTEVAQVPTASPTPAASVETRDPAATDGENVSQPDVTPTPSPPTEAETLVALNDGAGRVTLDATGRLSGITTLSPAQEAAIKSALKTRKTVNSAALDGLGRAGVLLGSAASGESFNVRGPFGTVVESARPTLRWDALKGATGYKVTVYDANFNSVAASPLLTTTSWTVAQPLKRGAVYSWYVTAQKEGAELKSPRPPAPEAKFKILDANRDAELRRVRLTNPRSHLALGVLYAQAGLLEEAERELTALVRANPKSDLAQRLLDNVRGAKKGKR